MLKTLVNSISRSFLSLSFLVCFHGFYFISFSKIWLSKYYWVFGSGVNLCGIGQLSPTFDSVSWITKNCPKSYWATSSLASPSQRSMLSGWWIMFWSGLGRVLGLCIWELQVLLGSFEGSSKLWLLEHSIVTNFTCFDAL